MHTAEKKAPVVSEDSKSPTYVLEIEGLRHRLEDRERRQDFVVSVGQPLRICTGSFTAILGPNACGKSTLLSVLGLLRKPTNLGDLSRFNISILDGDKVTCYDMRQEWKSETNIVRIRRKHFGFALQTGELLAALTVRENIALPLHLNGFSARQCRDRVAELLNGFGLLKGTKEFNLPASRINKISGGEYQRVALARAIAHRPAIVFVDEPTASLNRVTAREALRQLQYVQADSKAKASIIMITHDESLAKEFSDQIIRMRPAGPNAGEVESIVENVPSLQVGDSKQAVGGPSGGADNDAS